MFLITENAASANNMPLQKVSIYREGTKLHLVQTLGNDPKIS